MTPVADPSIPVQRGIRSLLTADAELMAMVAGVWDEPPERIPDGAPAAWVVFGTKQTTTDGDGVHGQHSRQVILALDTWTRARSSLPGDRVAARIVALLARRPEALDPHVEGHTVWRIVWEDSLSLDDEDREMRHRIDRFRIWTAQEEER